MRAYLAHPALTKDVVLQEILLQQQLGNFVKDAFNRSTDGGFCGCPIGCTTYTITKNTGDVLEPSNHSAYGKYLGIPPSLARIKDSIYTNLDLEEGQHLALRFFETIQPSMNLEGVYNKFMFWLLYDMVLPEWPLSGVWDHCLNMAIEGFRSNWKVDRRQKIVSMAYENNLVDHQNLRIFDAINAILCAVKGSYGEMVQVWFTIGCVASFLDCDRKAVFKKAGEKLLELMAEAPIE